jgi:hypothetical protein
MQLQPKFSLHFKNLSSCATKPISHCHALFARPFRGSFPCGGGATLFLLWFFAQHLHAQVNCPNPYFEVTRSVPTAPWNYQSSSSAPGAFQAFYTVRLRTSAASFPSSMTFERLNFSAKLTLNQFTSRINVPLTQQFSQGNYLQYLDLSPNAVANGEVTWTVGNPANLFCPPPEPGVTLNFGPLGNSIKLFTIVVDAAPGDKILMEALSGNVTACSPCGWEGEPLSVYTPNGALTMMPAPSACSPSRTLSFQPYTSPGLPGHRVSVLLQGQDVNWGSVLNKVDAVVHIAPNMLGFSDLDFIYENAPNTTGVSFFKKRKNADGSFDIYFVLNNFTCGLNAPPGTPQPLFYLVVGGQYNASQGGMLACSAAFGRASFTASSTCALAGTASTVSVPGYPACDNNLKVVASHTTASGCAPSLLFTVSHNNGAPLNLSYLKLSFGLYSEGNELSVGALSSTLPNPGNGTLTYIDGHTARYDYVSSTPVPLANGAQVSFPLDLTAACLKYYVLFAEATLVGGSTCSFGTEGTLPAPGSWPLCDPEVRVRVRKPDGLLLAPQYRVTVEALNSSYEMESFDDCLTENAFCPDLSHTPLQAKVEMLPSALNQHCACGVTTYDLVLISRHVLGLQMLLNHNAIAGDANKSASITAQDIVEVRKCILGIQTDFGPNDEPSWWYINDSYQFIPGNEFQNYGYRTQNKAPIVVGQPNVLNFAAVKVGDVNNSCFCAAQRPGEAGGGTPYLRVDAQQVRREGNMVSVPVWADAPTDLVALQAGLRFDPSVLALREVLPNPALLMWESVNFGRTRAAEGELRFAWAQPDGEALLPAQGLLFTLRFELAAGAELPRGPLCWASDNILEGYAYPEDGTEAPVRLRWEGAAAAERAEAAGAGPALALAPNPFAGTLRAFLYLEKAGEATLRLSDSRGARCFEQALQLGAGDNALEIPAEATAQPGLYFLQVETGGKTLQRRALRL